MNDHLIRKLISAEIPARRPDLWADLWREFRADAGYPDAVAERFTRIVAAQKRLTREILREKRLGKEGVAVADHKIRCAARGPGSTPGRIPEIER